MRSAGQRSFKVVLIKPSHYDDDGYVIQWWRWFIPSVETIQRELPIDLLEFMSLTPLPGCEDHKNLYLKQVPMDPDVNKYDLEHVTTAHPLMSAQELADVYQRAWRH